ncbi:MAG: alkaline phosphatase family protein [Thermoanaerobaculia bacterium]
MKLRNRASVMVLAFLLLAAAAAAPLDAAEKPGLIVVITVDQMRTDYLARFRPYFGRDGFNRFLERGAQFPETRHRHAVTFTGPGHASIGTGLDPRDHGIIGNRWYDVQSGHTPYCSEDARTAWVGAETETRKIPWKPASPVQLTEDSLGDRLKEKFPGSRVVAVGLKDRSPVLMAGRKADAAIWFEDRFGRFVTSTYYPPRPSLLKFNERLPEFFAKRKTWELSGKIPAAALEKITFDPPELYGSKIAGPGGTPSFPHPLPTVRAVLHSPYGDDLLLEFARHVIEDFSLGRQADGHPDLLFIGMSSTDYYGHNFGPDSKEIAEGIVRLDATLESFFRWLDARVGANRSLIFLTGDHGVQPIPQVALAKHRKATGRDDRDLAGRVDFNNGPGDAATVAQVSEPRRRLEQSLAKKYGYALRMDAPNAAESVVLLFEEPSLYLNRAALARRGIALERVKQDVRDWAKRVPGVLTAYTNTEILNGLPATAPHALPVERSFRPDRSGDVFVILKPGWMWSYGRDAGTTHGQPNDDDARVPLLAWGAGVRAGSWDARVSPLSIARTVGALLGFEAGAADAEILQPVLGRDMGLKKVAAAR